MPRVLLVLTLVACSATNAPPTRPPPPAPAPSPAPPPAPAPAPPIADASGCTADALHCCLADGRIIQPTCAPVVRQESDSWRRGADGTCEPCALRCLPPATRIRTPAGDVRLDQLAVGDLVMTVDESGHAVARPVMQIRALPVREPHVLVVLQLADGRSLRGSPGHPARTGLPIGDLEVGASLDGSVVVSRALEPYRGTATWDLLPAGETGAYWADDVLIDSTLRAR